MAKQEVFVDIYPCSCGHCTECGLNFVASSEELRRWAREDEEYYYGLGEWDYDE